MYFDPVFALKGGPDMGGFVARGFGVLYHYQ
jgi:hypothetical protein